MLVFISEGRLGNQIFQYAFLKTLAGCNNKIFVLGFDELREIFNNVDVVGFEFRNKHKDIEEIISHLYRVIREFQKLMLKSNLVSVVYVEHESINGFRRESDKIVFFEGLLKRIKFIKTGFFQSERFFDNKVVSNLIIKLPYLEKAESILREVPKHVTKIFIHLRDFSSENFKVFGKDPTLSMEYYVKGIDLIRNCVKDPYFIIISEKDNPMIKHFENVEEKTILAGNHYGVDFALMSLCDGAIISNSSFAWWGAYFLKRNKPDAIVIAPKYWLGWRDKIEYPKGTTPSFAYHLEI